MQHLRRIKLRQGRFSVQFCVVIVGYYDFIHAFVKGEILSGNEVNVSKQAFRARRTRAVFRSNQ